MSDNAPDGAGEEPDGPERAVGVGPHPHPWPDDDRLDPALLAGGDRRNVVDRYRYWRVAAIRADLDHYAVPLEVAVQNWTHDMNIGTVVRNANGFGIRRVHVVGRRRWNRRGAMVTDRYLHVEHHATPEDLVRRAAEGDLRIVAVENTADAQLLGATALPERSLMVFGQESGGVCDELLGAADLTVAIAMWGSTRSLNAGVASGIAMYEWSRQHRPPGVTGSTPGAP